VLKRGGRFFCLEFSTSEWPGFADLYELYASKVIPRIGKAVAATRTAIAIWSNRSGAFPGPRLSSDDRQCRLQHSPVEPILGGLVCIHSGWKI
jgi:demethylmenaquinone methyltransferase / 2-methoxy-6-polyprenyl-1,4-benzoquinol methylase